MPTLCFGESLPLQRAFERRTSALALALIFTTIIAPLRVRAAATGCTAPVGSSHSPIGAVWGAAFVGRAYVHPKGELKFDATKARDGFAESLARMGLHLDTPGTGSCVVYDRKHGIAAETQGGDSRSESIGLAPAPPVADVPDTDLSRVRSKRGLHLGMSVAEMTAVFGTPANVRTSTDGKRTYYYYRRAGKPMSDDALFIFERGRATFISLAEVGTPA